jgi:hypothetical protein
VLLTVLLAAPVAAVPKDLKWGDPTRKAIMNAVRVPVRKELKQPVIFQIHQMKLDGPWAFMTGVPKQPNGRDIDYRKTRYRKQAEEGFFDHNIAALVKKKGQVWQVVAWSIGHTDVTYWDWDRKYGAPRAVLGLPPRPAEGKR